MRKIVIAADSHGSASALRRILRAEPDAYAFVFLGDGYSDLDGLQEEFPQLRIYAVRGNCDFDREAPDEGLLAFGGVAFYYTHGHMHAVKYTLLSLADAALAQGADVALYGHTHVAELDKINGVLLFNPGSVGRALNGHPTYGLAYCEDGKVKFEHKEVPTA